MNTPLEEICDSANSELDDKADVDHDHSYDYSAINHDHDDDYAAINHDHDDDYAAINHDHALDYAAANHDHDDDYAIINHDHALDYAAYSHDHDLNYADIDHDHGYDYAAASHNHMVADILDFPEILTQLYVVAGSYGTESDLVPAEKIIFRHKFCEEVNFATDFAGSNMWAEVAADAETIFSITKNGSEIGTVTFAASGTVATFEMDYSETFEVGDILRVVSPVQDTTLAGIGWTFKGFR